MATFFDIPVQSLGGTPDLLGPLRGKVVLAVNVASRCGLTPQYTGLESLQSDLDGQKFSVVGFPCNQFGGQEPGTEREIAQFCSATYGVTFPMSAKLDVNGIHRHASIVISRLPRPASRVTSSGTSKNSSSVARAR